MGERSSTDSGTIASVYAGWCDRYFAGGCRVPSRQSVRGGEMAVEMRALVLTRYGGADATELRQVPLPKVEADQVLVQVHAVGLNPVDYKTRQGDLRILYRFRLPCVLGNELAGVVTEVGAAVTRFKQGDRVMARVAKHRMGAFAEYAAV